LELIINKIETIEVELASQDPVKITGARLVFMGDTVMNLELDGNNSSFRIPAGLETGNYTIVYDIEKDGKESTIQRDLVISNHGIDPSLPFDLQELA
jgi:hypothetical protein